MTSQKNIGVRSNVGLVAVAVAVEGEGGGGGEGEQGALLFSRKVVFITLNSVQGGSNLLIMWMKS